MQQATRSGLPASATDNLARSRNGARLLGGRERLWLGIFERNDSKAMLESGIKLQKVRLNAVKQSIMYNVYLKLMMLACFQTAF